jgi:hypothetical protein
MPFTTIPDWLGAAVIGALIAAIGFVAKSLYELWLNVQKIKAARLAGIIDLSVFLTASRIMFLVQNGQAQDLLKLLRKNHPNEIEVEKGFEANFAKLYDQFLPEELDLHGQIRNWTEYCLRPVNTAILDWLKNDTLFRTSYITANDARKRILAERLIQLQAHLVLWHGKYDAWIPNHPKHALVYLADEEQHGIAFPMGLDRLIQDVMSDLKKSAPLIPVVKE